ncbi:TetR/AcrR family transcriptional regulator [Sorangium atrum]|uniref:TetR/AcrR family transcriptional regulator n=1 Tax=Sorangium atrum TaxID=2995308 RepID=A0ABT5BZU8_9BACT|nr:TetR/AcrR family transcriptional regulator [Sorangium aterium]MDC0678471.1 TetR/AcrR family transcriptional regulator [Sorangium aterium]
MTDAKAAYHHGDLRNALVETATELVRTSGAEGFSLRDAARTLGVSANATYRHFDSKSALLTAVASADYVHSVNIGGAHPQGASVQWRN